MTDWVESFRAHFDATALDAAPQVYWAPGRVNLIGDHIDYCGGAVLPMPIQFGTTVAVRLTNSGRVRAISTNVPDVIDLQYGARATLSRGSWGRFVAGALDVLSREGVDINGADVLVGGDIPGSGLSSSASLAIGLIYALATASNRSLAPLQLALAAQRVEHEFVGVQCGLMDQAVIALASPGAALLFDCVDHGHRAIAIDDPTIRFVVVDTGRARQLVDSAYNARMNETRAAAAALGVAHLARVAPDVFEARKTLIRDGVVQRRAQHVVTESGRVTRAAAALDSRDWFALGRAFSESHASLRDDYEVSCPELDALAHALEAQPGCYGARMTGAGFGGSVVALVDAAQVDSALAAASATYSQRFGVVPRAFVARSLGGVRSIDG
jgi:galactokinase